MGIEKKSFFSAYFISWKNVFFCKFFYSKTSSFIFCVWSKKWLFLLYLYGEKQYLYEKVNFCSIFWFYLLLFFEFFSGLIPKKKSENPRSPIPKNFRDRDRDRDQPNPDFFRDRDRDWQPWSKPSRGMKTNRGQVSVADVCLSSSFIHTYATKNSYRLLWVPLLGFDRCQMSPKMHRLWQHKCDSVPGVLQLVIVIVFRYS